MVSRRKIILILAILPLVAGLLAVGCDQNVGVGSPVEPDLPVATAVLNDLIGVFDLSHSWTGWYPAAKGAVAAPQFGQWLVLRDGRPERTGLPAAEGVPILDVIGRGAGVKRADAPPSRW